MKRLYKIKMVDGTRYEFPMDGAINWGGDCPYLFLEFTDHNLLLMKSNIISISVTKKTKGEQNGDSCISNG